MADFTASPSELGFVRVKDMPVRGTMTKQLTITGNPDPGDDITLSKPGSEAWLTIPATCEHGVPFNVTVDPAVMAGGFQFADRTAIVRASYTAYDDLDVDVHFQSKPGGPPP